MIKKINQDFLDLNQTDDNYILVYVFNLYPEKGYCGSIVAGPVVKRLVGNIKNNLFHKNIIKIYSHSST